MDLDLTQTGFLLFFLALLGYIIGSYFDSGYLGSPLRPKGGDFERFLKYSSIGIVILIITSLLSILLFYGIIPALAIILFPQLNTNLLLALIIIFLLLVGLLSVIIVLSPFFGGVMRSFKNKYNPREITLETSNNTSIVVREIHDEDTDYFFFIDIHENWGSIKKSLVNRIRSVRRTR